MKSFNSVGTLLLILVSTSFLVTNAHAARSSISIMNPRNTIHVDKNYSYGYTYLSGNALDVYETPNRRIGWAVNYDFLDKNFLRPVSIAYATYIPEGIRSCVYNFNQNLREVNNTVNNLVALEPVDSSVSLARFAINSTIGIGGCFDVASHMNLERKRMTLSTALGKWGVDQGGYVVLPVYGVGTYRSLIGDTIDTMYFPFTYFPWWLDMAFWATNGVDSRARVLKQDEVLSNALDPYSQARDFYLMYEASLVGDEKSVEESTDVDSYLDEIDE